MACDSRVACRACDSRVACRACDSRVACRACDSRVACRACDSRVASRPPPDGSQRRVELAALHAFLEVGPDVPRDRRRGRLVPPPLARALVPELPRAAGLERADLLLELFEFLQAPGMQIGCTTYDLYMSLVCSQRVIRIRDSCPIPAIPRYPPPCFPRAWPCRSGIPAAPSRPARCRTAIS